MPGIILNLVSTNEPNGHQDEQPDSDDSEDYASDAQVEEIRSDDFPGYFLEHNGRLFPSPRSLTPYPFPVDTPEQEVRHQDC